MLTIATITDKARKTLQDTPNIFQIALIPVLISVSVQLFSSTRQSILEVYLSQDGSNLHFSYLLSSILFPIFYGLLMSLLYLSITWALFKGIKQGANEYRVSSSLAIFQYEHFKKIFFTFNDFKFWFIIKFLSFLISVNFHFLFFRQKFYWINSYVKLF